MTVPTFLGQAGELYHGGGGHTHTRTGEVHQPLVFFFPLQISLLGNTVYLAHNPVFEQKKKRREFAKALQIPKSHGALDVKNVRETRATIEVHHAFFF